MSVVVKWLCFLILFFKKKQTENGVFKMKQVFPIVYMNTMHEKYFSRVVYTILHDIVLHLDGLKKTQMV